MGSGIILVVFLSAIATIGAGAMLAFGLRHKIAGAIAGYATNKFLSSGEFVMDKIAKVKTLKKPNLDNPFVNNGINGKNGKDGKDGSNSVFKRANIPMMRGVDNGNMKLPGFPNNMEANMKTLSNLGKMQFPSNERNTRGRRFRGRGREDREFGGSMLPYANDNMQNMGMGLNRPVVIPMQKGKIVNQVLRPISGPVIQGGGRVYNAYSGPVDNVNQLVGTLTNNKNNMNNLNQLSGNILNQKNKGAKRFTQNAGNILNKKTTGAKKITQNVGGNTLNNLRGRVTVKRGQSELTKIAQSRVAFDIKGASRQVIAGNVKKLNSQAGEIKTKRLAIKGFARPNNLIVETLHAPYSKLRIRELARMENVKRTERNGLVVNASIRGYRTIPPKRLSASATAQDRRELERGNELQRQIHTMAPTMNTRDVRKIARQVTENEIQMKREREQAALENANRKMAYDTKRALALKSVLNSNSYAKYQYDQFMKSYDITEEEHEQIKKKSEEKARELTKDPKDRKEYIKNYSEEYQKLMAEREKNVEDAVKSKILENERYAKSIIGTSGSKELSQKLNDIDKARDKEALKQLIQQDVDARSSYLDKNPQNRKSTFTAVNTSMARGEREKEIQTALNEINEERRTTYTVDASASVSSGSSSSSRRRTTISPTSQANGSESSNAGLPDGNNTTATSNVVESTNVRAMENSNPSPSPSSSVTRRSSASSSRSSSENRRPNVIPVPNSETSESSNVIENVEYVEPKTERKSSTARTSRRRQNVIPVENSGNKRRNVIPVENDRNERPSVIPVPDSNTRQNGRGRTYSNGNQSGNNNAV